MSLLVYSYVKLTVNTYFYEFIVLYQKQIVISEGVELRKLIVNLPCYSHIILTINDICDLN